MLHRLIILQGGDDVKKRTNASLIRNVSEMSGTKRILVIPWTSGSPEKENAYRSELTDYFSESGFVEVEFLDRNETLTETERKFSSVDVVYLPGGDPDTFYNEVEKRGVHHKLRSFKGTIIGNSAGAIILSRGAMHEGELHRGFGIVDFFISVHYKVGEECGDSVEGKPAINIPEGMYVGLTGA
jgi:peptidase E